MQGPRSRPLRGRRPPLHKLRRLRGHARSASRPTAPMASLAMTLALYANQFEVGYNAFEFLIDFAQDYGEDTPLALGKTHTRIVSSPPYAKRFCALLQDCIAQYEARFGLIAEVPQLPDEGL